MRIKTAKRRCAKIATAVVALTMAASLSTSTMFASANVGDPLSGGKFKSDYSSLDEVIKAGRDLNLELAAEGFVLMKNANKALPVSTSVISKAKVTVLGETADTLATGGAGSGAQSRPSGSSDVVGEQATIFDSLEAANFEVNSQVKALYESPQLAPKGQAGGFGASGDSQYNGVEYMTVCSEGETGTQSFAGKNYKAAATDPLGAAKETFAAYNTALVVISRTGAENADNKAHHVNGHADVNEHYLELNDSERSLFAYAKANFKKVIAIINSPSAMELGCLEKDEGIDAMVWIGQPGWNGVMALGKVLNGEVNPSGRLVDFYMADFTTDPTWYNFGNYTQANYAVNGEYGSRNKAVLMGTDNNGTATNSSETAIDYAEGIYIGYRYYETVYEELLAKKDKATADAWWTENVVYPFGYGLSYTTFKQEIKSVDGDLSKANKDGEVTVTVTVTNTGDVAGKEVVQVYSSAPYTEGGIEKAAVDLVGFGKTGKLAPGASEDVQIKVAVKDMASFDYDDRNNNDFCGYELETGNYTLSVRNDSHTVLDSETSEAKEEVTWDEDGNSATPNNIFSQGDNSDKSSQWAASNTLAHAWTVSGEDHYLTRDQLVDDEGELYDLKQLAWLVTDENKFKDEAFNVTSSVTSIRNGGIGFNGKQKDFDNAATVEQETDYINLWTKTEEDIPENWTQGAGVKNEDGYYETTILDMAGVAYDDPKWDSFINQLTLDEIVKITLDSPYQFKGLDSIKKPLVTTADGPGQFSSGWAWVCEVVIASTWNTELASEQGAIVGEESMWLGNGTQVASWFGPAMNTHRNPLAGRNFEYYSQDGLLAGKMAAAVVKSATDKGLHVVIKHAFLNDMETNRLGVCTFVTEQAMRLIYAKPFELAIREGHANGLMLTMCRFGVDSSASYVVNQQLFTNEWGYNGLTLTDACDDPVASAWSSYSMARGLTMPLNNQAAQYICRDFVRWNEDKKMVEVKLTKNNTEASDYTWVESPTQWYWMRELVKRHLYFCANSNSMQNGVDFFAILNRQDTVNASIGKDVSINVINLSEANKAFGKDNYDVTVTGLPAGLRYNKATGIIEGKPSEGYRGTITVLIRGGEKGEDLNRLNSAISFDINVSPFITVNKLAKAGEEFSGSLTATFFNDSNYVPELYVSWQEFAFDKIGIYSGALTGGGWGPGTVSATPKFTLVEGENLPEGLTLNSETGVISGTPTTKGTYTFKVKMEYSQVLPSDMFWTLPASTALSLEETVTFTVYEEIPAIAIINGTIWLNGADTGISAQGPAGVDGIDGIDGVDGTNGIGIASTVINDEGELVLTYTDGTTVNLGVVVGTNGTDGVDGAPGTNGTNGTNGINGINGVDGGSGLAVAGIVMGALGIVAAGAAVAFVVVSKKKN